RSKRDWSSDVCSSDLINIETIFDLANSTQGQQLLSNDFNLVRELGVRGFPTVVIVNNDNQGTKIVGARDLNVYIDTLKKLNSNEKIVSKPLPDLELYLKKQHRLFSKEIEVMYDIKQDEVPNFVKQNLNSSVYTAKNILGENYYEFILS